MKKILFIVASIFATLPVLAAPNKKEVNQLKQFLQATSARGDANYIRLGIVINDPESWRGVVWNNNGNITSIEWRDRELAGSLNVSNFTALQRLDIARNGITEVNISGCKSLQYVDVSRNHITNLQLKDCSSLTRLNCSRNRLSELSITGAKSFAFSLTVFPNAVTLNASITAMTIKTIRDFLFLNICKSSSKFLWFHAHIFAKTRKTPFSFHKLKRCATIEAAHRKMQTPICCHTKSK